MRLLLVITIVSGLASCIALPRAGHAQESEAVSPEHSDSSGHGGHFGASNVSTSPVELKPDLSIYTFGVFVVLLLILWKFAWGPISAGLEKREQGIAEQIAAAQRAHDEAKRLLAEHERKLASAADEVRAIIEEARRDAAHTQQEIVAQARADAAAEMERAKREVETARDQALKQLAETGANLAVDLAGRILKAEISAAKHSQLINESLARFPQHVPGRN